MNKVLLGTRLFSIVALAGSICPSLMAQGQSEEHRPFEINGHAWGSKAEFIERGRCVTRQPNDEEAEEMETIFKNAGGGRGTGAGGVNEKPGGGGPAAGGTIDVYFHVIRRGTGIAN